MSGLIEDLTRELAGTFGESIRVKKAAKTPIAPEHEEYVRQITEAAQNGDVQAMLVLGNHYIDGAYVSYSPAHAEFWWNEAAKRNNSCAQYNLGLLYLGQLSYKVKRDYEKAAQWLQCAANNGMSEAQQVLQEEFKWSNFRNKWVKK